MHEVAPALPCRPECHTWHRSVHKIEQAPMPLIKFTCIFPSFLLLLAIKCMTVFSFFKNVHVAGTTGDLGKEFDNIDTAGHSTKFLLCRCFSVLQRSRAEVMLPSVLCCIHVCMQIVSMILSCSGFFISKPLDQSFIFASFSFYTFLFCLKIMIRSCMSPKCTRPHIRPMM